MPVRTNCGKGKDRKGDTRTLRPSQTLRIVSIGKSSEMVDLTVNKSEKYGQIKALSKRQPRKGIF